MYDVIPLTPLRKIIAARMSDAKRTIPHYQVAVDIEVDALLALRKEHNAEHDDQKISVNDLVIKACAGALMEKTAVNVQLVDNEIHQYKQADISVIIAVDGGLSTPVVRNVNQKSVLEISREVKELAKRAPLNQLKRSEIAGGSFSISNLGMYGVDQFDAIINPPQGAILAVGAATPKPVVKNGSLRAATVMRVTLSLDHRVIDGATGAEFLAVLRELLQNPVLLLEGCNFSE